MGLILDLAVAALGLVVIGSLAALAWTLAVSAVRATRRERERVAARRLAVAELETRLVAESARAVDILARAAARTTPPRPYPPDPESEPTHDEH